jgi:uncharacterized protein (DUF305 family)
VFTQCLKARWLGLAIGLGPLAAGSLAAQEMQHGMVAHGGAGGPAVEAYLAASDRMHRDMAIELSGDPDVDVARGMIPHHQGAIDMARALLEYGQDPELRALAEGIIAAQEQEIAFLRSWLAERGEKAD